MRAEPARLAVTLAYYIPRNCVRYLPGIYLVQQCMYANFTVVSSTESDITRCHYLDTASLI